jgi:RNA polymerase sigma-70 factor (ECF subfamily)
VSETQEDIFKDWIDCHKGLVFKVVRTYAAGPDDRDDLFQEILLRLWFSIPHFQGRARETTWIYRVALNTALTWQRDETKKRKRRVSILNFDDLADPQETTESALQNKQCLDQLYSAISQLPKTERSVILLHLDGLSYEEMANILGVSETNVGARLNRAKKALANLLGGLKNEF